MAVLRLPYADSKTLQVTQMCVRCVSAACVFQLKSASEPHKTKLTLLFCTCLLPPLLVLLNE
jgi:hypothetical protein